MIQSLIAAGLLLLGFFVFRYTGGDLGIAFLGFSAVGGYCVLLIKTRRVLLRFGSLTWTAEELFRHCLLSGDTGCGKTTSGFHTILFQISKNVPNWGGLVLGVKGDESEYISELLDHAGRKDDLIDLQVRPTAVSTNWIPPHRFNLLSDRRIPWMTHAKYIVDIAASMTDGQQHAFFRPMAQIAMANAFALIDELRLPVTLTRTYDLLTSQEIAAKFIKRLKRLEPTPERLRLIAFFQTSFIDAKAYEQREAIEGTIKTYLGFFTNPDVAAVFSSDLPNTFSFNEVNNGAVITITMPQSLASERRYVQTYLKMLFYNQALSRLDKLDALRRNENLLLLVADEFQDLVTSSEDGISDHKIVDRIRSAKTAIIAGMQSELSADPAIGERKRKVLSLNLRTRFIFRAADADDAELSAKFIGKRTIWKQTRSSKPLGQVTVSRRQEQEFYVKPEKLLRLPDHQAVIVHPSKRFRKKKLAPIDGKGGIYPWY